MQVVSNDMYSFVFGEAKREDKVMTDDEFNKFISVYELKLRAMIEAHKYNKYYGLQKENNNEQTIRLH